MSDQKEGASLTLPIQVQPYLFTYEYRRLLSEVCVPLDKAAPGDIVALCLQGKMTGSAFYTTQIKHVVHREAEPGEGYSIKAYSAFDEYIQRQLAFSCMAFQCHDVIDDEMIGDIIATMPDQDDNHGTGIMLTLLPDAAFINESSLYMRLFSQKDRSTLQQIIDGSLLTLLPKRPESAHELLEMKPELDRLLTFANSFWSASGPSFGDPHTPLRLPRLDGLLGDGVAREPS